MAKYRLKKDLPWAKAGSEWQRESRRLGAFTVIHVPSDRELEIPLGVFSEWFEEIKPEITFTKEQAEVLKNEVNRRSLTMRFGDNREEMLDSHKFIMWLKEHTEQ